MSNIEIKEEHIKYLDGLKESGVVNMFGATSYLMDEFMPMSPLEARSILFQWMKLRDEDIDLTK